MEQNINKPHVLYVEDDEIAIMYVSRILSAKFKVTTAQNSVSAYECIKNDKFDVVLMDINLGRGESGVELAKRISSTEGYEKTPIIALTAFAMERDKEYFLGEGFAAYLSKPFRSPQLIELISSLLN